MLAETELSLSQQNRTAKQTHARYGVLGLTLALTAVSYLDRICISTAAPSIKADLHLTDAQMGYVFSAFTFAYALFEIPSGWLADRFGPRLMLTRIVVWWSAMTAATGLARGFPSIFFMRLLFGVGEAGTFPGIARAYARWLPMREHGRAFGLAIMAGALGGAATQPLVVGLLSVINWRLSFSIFALVGMVWAIAWYLWFRDDPHHHWAVNENELRVIGSHPPKSHSPPPWRNLLFNRNLFTICCMYGGTIYGWYFYLTWLPTYLLRARGFNLKQVGWLSALPLLSIAAGVFLGGLLSDHLVRRYGARFGRRLPGLIGLPFAAIAIIIAIMTPVPKTSAFLLALAAGLAAFGVAPAWAVCLEIGGHHAGVVSGTMNMFGNLGGTLSPMVVGLCLQHWNSWNTPLVTVAIFYLVAAICWIFIDPMKLIE